MSASYCKDCGHPIRADASPGVWLHDEDELGGYAYNLNEEHAARPPESTPHPSETARDNWTAMPHWVVMVLEGPGEERCAGHHPTRRYAGEQRERVRARAWEQASVDQAHHRRHRRAGARDRARLSGGRMSAPLTCPNGHAMDEGLFECPACGAYRPSATDPRALIRGGRVVGFKRRERCCGIIWEHGALSQAQPCRDCPLKA